MTEGWPNTIDGKYPQSFLNKGVQSGYDANSIVRSQMEIGVKLRRRDTLMLRNFTGSIMLTVAQFEETFLPWFEDTLGGGVLPFVWKHPYTGATTTFKFTDLPTEDYQEGGLVAVSLPLQVVPT